MRWYGSFPFPLLSVSNPELGHFTKTIFIGEITMLSRLKNHVLWRNHGTCGDERVTRWRVPADDVRMLIQGLMSTGKSLLERERDEDDDGNLIDVLYAALSRVNEDRAPIWAFRRRDVVEVARTLPSSRSRNLDQWMTWILPPSTLSSSPWLTF
jgi:hypothetical protein